MAAVSRRVIEGAGTPEHEWLSWPGLFGVVPFDLAGYSVSGSRLVVVAPHPDDEVLACGGLIRLHQQRGGHVLIVAVTDGEASHAGAGPWTRASLAATRRTESVAGLARLADQPIEVVRLGLPDGSAAAHARQLDAALRRLLCPADLVVSVWRLDGHPDHDAVGEATASASRAVGTRLLEAPVWMWHWAHPADVRVPWDRLRALRLPTDVVAAKADALAAHVTQLSSRGNGLGPVLDESIQTRARRLHEYYFV